MTSMSRRGVRLSAGWDLAPCICNSLRMVSRAVTQLYDDILRPSALRVTQFSMLATIARMGEANFKQLEDTLAIDQTTLTRSLALLARDGVIERAPHPDGRIKAMRLTLQGRRALEAARPLWARAQDTVLRELGTKAWPDARRRLAELLRVAVETRRASLGGRPLSPSRAQRKKNSLTVETGKSAIHEGSKPPRPATRGTSYGR
jgi:DNA-binding MarR family transcriptional regulator